MTEPRVKITVNKNGLIQDLQKMGKSSCSKCEYYTKIDEKYYCLSHNHCDFRIKEEILLKIIKQNIIVE